MAITNIYPSGSFVYRGAVRCTKVRDFIHPNTLAITIAGDRDPLVFGTENVNEALAYCIIKTARQSSLSSPRYPDQVLEVAINLPKGKTFGGLLPVTTYLQTLPASGFRGVIKDSGVPLEWVSQDSVPVLWAEKVSVEDAVRLGGVQVFSVHPDFDVLADHLLGEYHQLCREGKLVWENTRPELVDTIPSSPRYSELYRYLKKNNLLAKTA